jgi:hypothetical protein
MPFWHTVFVGRQVCPKRLVGLNFLQVYTASHVEHVYSHDVQNVKIQRQYDLKKNLLNKTGERNINTLHWLFFYTSTTFLKAII